MKRFLTVSLVLLTGCVSLPFLKNNNVSRKWFPVEIRIENNTGFSIVAKISSRHEERLQCPLPRYSDLKDCEVIIRRGASELMLLHWEGEVRRAEDGSEVYPSVFDIEIRYRIVRFGRGDVGAEPRGEPYKLRLTPEDIAFDVLLR